MRSGGFYSFTVLAEEEVPLPEHMMLIEPGVNHFNAQVEDLRAFLFMLREAKVTVKHVRPIGVAQEDIDDIRALLTEAPVV